MEKEYVVLVDKEDKALGVMEKMYAHTQGVLHRAISVFIFNSQNQLLLQKRADNKYHSGGLWTNSCCSHPRWEEGTKQAAERRLMEEMGISCELEYLTQITYSASLDNNMLEHELDHIFAGRTDEIPKPDPEEVAEYKYMSPDEIKQLLNTDPDSFTEWFKILFEPVINELKWKKYL
jgi:isopentenyl-diphosphate delta-isomerase